MPSNSVHPNSDSRLAPFLSFFFFNDTATTEIYTLSLHDALPISAAAASPCRCNSTPKDASTWPASMSCRDRKSTRLNSSHSQISYAVFCLKKKKKTKGTQSSHKPEESGTQHSPSPRRSRGNVCR